MVLVEQAYTNITLLYFVLCIVVRATTIHNKIKKNIYLQLQKFYIYIYNFIQLLILLVIPVLLYVINKKHTVTLC